MIGEQFRSNFSHFGEIIFQIFSVHGVQFRSKNFIFLAKFLANEVCTSYVSGIRVTILIHFVVLHSADAVVWGLEGSAKCSLTTELL